MHFTNDLLVCTYSIDYQYRLEYPATYYFFIRSKQYHMNIPNIGKSRKSHMRQLSILIIRKKICIGIVFSGTVGPYLIWKWISRYWLGIYIIPVCTKCLYIEFSIEFFVLITSLVFFSLIFSHFCFSSNTIIMDESPYGHRLYSYVAASC